MEVDLLNLLVQAGGAISVCGMFLWYLRRQREGDDERDDKFFAQLDKATAYLRERDEQSKQIALSGHSALREVAEQVSMVREELSRLKAEAAG